MTFSTLVDELVLHVAERLEMEREINALAQCSRRLYGILNPYLYYHHMQQPGKGDATLIWAAKRGRDGTARHLFQSHLGRGGENPGNAIKINPNCTDPQYGLTALSWAAAKGHETVVQVLLKSEDIKPDLKNRVGRTPLSHAAENGHVGVVKLLLIQGNGRVDPDSSNSGNQRTPLLWAGSPRATDAIEVDVQENSVQSRSEDGSECYSWAAGPAYESILNLLLEHGANLEANGNGLYNPLSWAAVCGYTPLVKLLLDKGAEIDMDRFGAQSSALYWASHEGHKEVVALLLGRGAKLEGRTSPLAAAASNGHGEVVKMLLEKITTREKGWGGTPDWLPLIEAAENGQAEAVEILLAANARKWPGLPISSRSLFLAAKGGYDAVVKLLIEGGIEIDSDPRPQDGLTTVAAAVMNNHQSTVKLLLNSGIDIHINGKDDYGWTALTWAARLAAPPLKDGALVDMLLQYGADSSFLKAPKSTDPITPHTIDKNYQPGWQEILPTRPVSFR